MQFLILLSILFCASIAQSATIYVSKSGNNANSCAQAQSQATAKVSISAGISCLTAGSTLSVGAGSYAEGINANGIVSGSSWTSTTKIVGAGRGSTIVVPSGTHGINFTSSVQYIEFSDFDINAAKANNNGINFDSSANHIRFKNMGITGAPNQGVLARSASSFLEFINMEIVGPGTCYQARHCHSLYMWASNCLVDRVLMRGNDGNGIQLYETPNNCIVRNSVAYGNTDNGIFVAGSGHKIFNNTIYGNSQRGIWNAGANTQIKNNIVFGNAVAQISDDGSGTSLSNNLTTDPKFVNAAAKNFQLQSTSPAVNAGVNLAEVTIDFNGVTRPQGGAYDIGAYEYVAGGGSQPSAPSNLNIMAE